MEKLTVFLVFNTNPRSLPFLLYAMCNLYGDVSMMVLKGISFVLRDAWWPSGRASDSGARGRGSILTHVLKHDAFTSQK